ncbi:uncharacterized protein TM35_000441320 [Trypanosoma theileri]|uniref:Serine/threonine-protein phosphatase 4 regulatory subunit 3-like central domain-containing protein n=1 Tax=Trypanosoma theileri TaxID=67003 RepID=A0A1X0NIG3_9TRYP|nr:uncharacterized protein TM35_000441320 [Trypanosoma theileri]ORC84476.1 hypothetical protein TM35_000441320 [Trypanosoma theileri]
MDDGADILTKAKLYATMSDDDSWTEMGVGIVSVVLRPAADVNSDESNDGGSSSNNNSNNNAEQVVGQLEIIDIDNPAELLMSTPITLSDAYVVQNETILWWSDPQLGRLMACSFNTKEGCEKIRKEIVAYQNSRKTATTNEINGSERANTPSICSHWTVCRENLPAILSAAMTNAQRFGVFVRGRESYFKELAELFQLCQREGDLRGMDLIGQITLALLRSPFSTDGKIIAQFVENSLVDTCVDIVQYAIGRRDQSTGFVSFEERRATFRNPLQLPESIVARIHVLYSCGYLKDLLPLSLDEADAVPSSLLSTYLTSSKFRLVEDICRSPLILPQAFQRAYNDVANAFEVVAFVHDMCKTIKNTMMPLDCKTTMFEALVGTGLLPFLRFVIANAIELYQNVGSFLPAQAQAQTQGTPASLLLSSSSSSSEPPPPPTLPSSFRVMPGMAMQMACDIVCNCIMLYPAGRGGLVAEALTSPNGCLLELLLQCIITSKRSAELQAAFDAVVSCGIGILQYLPGIIETGGPTKRDVVRFWVEGAAGQRPPLLLLVVPLAEAFLRGEPIPHGSHEEIRVLHVLKVLTSLVGEIDEQLSHSFASVFQQANLISSLEVVLRTDNRSSANLQSSVVALVTTILESGKRRLVDLLVDGLLLETALRRYMKYGHRNNILSSSLAHLFDGVCRAIHSEKSGGARTFSHMASSPFLHILHSGEDDSLASRTADGQENGNSSSNNTCQTIGGRLWSMHGEELRTRCPSFARKLEHALQETPEEARSADAESSSVASTLERNIKSITDVEFDAMVMDFGVELQPRGSVITTFPNAPLVAQNVTEKTNRKEDHSDDDFHDHEEEEEEEEEEQKEEDDGEDEDYKEKEDENNEDRGEPLLKRSRSESTSSVGHE